MFEDNSDEEKRKEDGPPSVTRQRSEFGDEDSESSKLTHIDLSPAIDSILAGTYEYQVAETEFEQSFVTFEDDSEEEKARKNRASNEIWDRAKEDRNALAAIFINDFWQDFEKVLPTMNFAIKLPEKMTPTLRAQARFELQNTIYNFFEAQIQIWADIRTNRLSQPRDRWDNLDFAFYHFFEMVEFADRHFENSFKHPGDFLTHGIGTAIEVIFSTFQLVDDISDAENIPLTLEEKYKCASKAYGPFVQRFASMNLEIVVPVLSFLRGKNDLGFMPENFKLLEDSEGHYLQLDHSVFYKIKDPDGNLILNKKTNTDTTWCPARYRLGKGRDVMRKFYTWCKKFDQKYINNMDIELAN